MKKFLAFFLALHGCNFIFCQEKPRVSIITSVFKGEEFIEQFLEDITRQTIFNECELILVNANSPENEEPVILAYAKQYPNIVYVRLQYDPGIYGVWNIAAKLAKADFITNANLDDRRSRDCFETLAKTLEANPYIDLVYSPFYATHEANQKFENRKVAWYCYHYDFSLPNMKDCLPGPGPMWRKSMHDKYGYFNEWFTSAGDWEMWLRAAVRGAKYKRIPKFLMLYYENPEGISTNQNPKRAAQRNKERKLLKLKYKYLWKKKKELTNP